MPVFALCAMSLEDYISMAQRHVRHGERHIARQHERIARLRTNRLPTVDALRFLSLLEEVHALQREHLSRLLSKSAGSKVVSELSAKTQVAKGGRDAISIPDPIVRLALELEQELNSVKLKWLTAKPPRGKLH
ncbi:hypothetical protein [Mesorhizobium sp. AA23]|uniref:hypothetical protein n=1 Tax=Mesorhizobium sp. AA23 TaxID=1854058 RepID=UPI0007FD752A|nr:hypothetical protein [Mesorhizobium sp. AA23]OBQ96803.1 hypothetical protein A9K66_20845 [Mesorhizobium sp. AA23]